MDWVAIAKDFGIPIAGFAIFGYLIVTGRLVPGKTHDDVRAQRDKAQEMVYKLASRVAADVGDVSNAITGRRTGTGRRDD